MAGLIVPTVCRYTINQRFNDRNVANIFDYSFTFLDSISRDETCLHFSKILLDAWDHHILAEQSNNMTALSVSWVDLDNEDGSSGITTEGQDETWPAVGAGTGNPWSGNVAALITKVAPGGGRRFRNGRTYLCGLDESANDDDSNELTPTQVGLLDAAFSDFYDDTQGNHDSGISSSYDSNPVVVHTHEEDDPPVIVVDGYSTITSFSTQLRLATQRRRLR